MKNKKKLKFLKIKNLENIKNKKKLKFLKIKNLENLKNKTKLGHGNFIKISWKSHGIPYFSGGNPVEVDQGHSVNIQRTST